MQQHISEPLLLELARAGAPGLAPYIYQAAGVSQKEPSPAQVEELRAQVMHVAGQVVDIRVQERLRGNPGLSYGEAMRRVLADDPQLCKQYNFGD